MTDANRGTMSPGRLELVKDIQPEALHTGSAKDSAFTYTLMTNSGLVYEKPANSFWSKFMMKSLSVGVSSTGCLVNSLSKLEVSRLSLCQTESKHIKTEAEAAANMTRTCQLPESRGALPSSLKALCRQLLAAACLTPALSSYYMLALGEKTWCQFSLRRKDSWIFFLRIALKRCVFVWRGVLHCDFEVNYIGNYSLSQLMP